MEKLYKYIKESLLDNEEDLLNKFDKSMFIGGYYDIDIENIKYNHLKNIFKIGLLNIKPKYDIIDSPKITIDDDLKINKMIEVLCRFILNLPIRFLNKRPFESDIDYWEPLWDCQKSKFGKCYISQNIGGDIQFYADTKSMRVDIGSGVKSYVTPNIYIPLIKK